MYFLVPLSIVSMPPLARQKERRDVVDHHVDDETLRRAAGAVTRRKSAAEEVFSNMVQVKPLRKNAEALSVVVDVVVLLKYVSASEQSSALGKEESESEKMD